MATFTLMTTEAGLQAPRLTGTLTTNGTTAVVGVGSEFVADLVGYTFRFVGGAVDYTIASVTDATHLTTTTAVPTGSGQIAFLSSDQGLLAANFHLLGTAAVADAGDFQTANASTTLLGNSTTGSGSTIVLANSPTLVTPSLGAGSADSLETPHISMGGQSPYIGMGGQWPLINMTYSEDGAAKIKALNLSGTGYELLNYYDTFYCGRIVNGSWVNNPLEINSSGNVTVNAGLLTIKHHTAVPSLSVNGQISIAYVGTSGRIYFRANGNTYYVTGSSASFEIPAQERPDPLSPEGASETIEVGDLVLGVIDRNVGDGETPETSALHGVYTTLGSGLRTIGGVTGDITIEDGKLLCDGRRIKAVNGLLVVDGVLA